MNKLFLRYSYLIYFCIMLACQGEEAPKPDTRDQLDSPEERKAFFSAQNERWKLNQLTFAEPTVVAELSEDPYNLDSAQITDLYAELPPCRLDDVYSFGFEYGNVPIEFLGQEGRCDPQEPSHIEKGIYLEFNDSLTVAQADFRNNQALQQFLGFKVNLSGSGYLGYSMEWKVKSLSPDSINIKGSFTKRELPDLSIQFIPAK
ncbi:hypothetical protein OKW21_006622 [Catalinimonas alkaloidigena]|uniref:hypothetical protein n=1 Tax=Catalinimonas alkaloidigena TaxID=1075417 RepID=UPI0024067EF7|nr:hypothetical protein [Catalinimonas alkaloidigena]MDF9801313.1 hypothetical protein [Catalinimonas alkaloidigena]